MARLGKPDLADVINEDIAICVDPEGNRLEGLSQTRAQCAFPGFLVERCAVAGANDHCFVTIQVGVRAPSHRCAARVMRATVQPSNKPPLMAQHNYLGLGVSSDRKPLGVTFFDVRFMAQGVL